MDNYNSKTVGYFGTPRAEMLEFVPQNVESILEIGCGAGAFGALVKQHRNCKYTGVELTDNASEKASKLLDRVIVANIENSTLPFQPGAFDCLILNDILEHLIDPWKILKELTLYLKPGGYVVISVPNVRFSEVIKDLVFRKKWEYREQGVLDQTHLRFFTESSLRELCFSAALEVITLKGINGIQYAWRLQLINIILLGALNDMRYMQFGCVCKLAK